MRLKVRPGAGHDPESMPMVDFPLIHLVRHHKNVLMLEVFADGRFADDIMLIMATLCTVLTFMSSLIDFNG